MSYEFSQSVSEDLAKVCKKHGLHDCMVIGKREEGDPLFLLRVYYNKESPTLTIISSLEYLFPSGGNSQADEDKRVVP